MVELKITVGGGKVSNRRVPVVPDQYLSSELLLGCDILGKAPLTWNHQDQTLIWGNELFPIHFIRPKNQVEKITVVPAPTQKVNQLRVRQKFELSPFKTKFFPIKVEEQPGTTLVIHPDKNMKAVPFPFVTTVNSQGEIYFPNENFSKKSIKISPGTLLGTYELSTVEETPVCPVSTIKNELMPSTNPVAIGGCREENLKHLLDNLN